MNGRPAQQDGLSAKRRILRLAEFAALYIVGPLLLTFLLPRKLIIPMLWVMSILALAMLLRDKSFDRRSLIRIRPSRGGEDDAVSPASDPVAKSGNRRMGGLAPAIRPRIGSGQKFCAAWSFRGMLLHWAVASLALCAMLYFHCPDWLFAFPRKAPLIWGVVMLAYPLISVYPQGLVFRALYAQRYAGIWRSEAAARIIGAAAFSLAHLAFRNSWALLFTFVGGLLFLRTYERTRSLPISCLEHALYGDIVFTIGWGVYLFHGGTATAFGAQ